VEKIFSGIIVGIIFISITIICYRLIDHFLSKFVKRKSYRALLFMVFFIIIFIIDFYNWNHNPENIYDIALAQATGKNYFIAFFDSIMSKSTRVGWIMQVALILFFYFKYFTNKKKEESVLDAMLLIVNRGELKINLNKISNQIGIDNTEVLNLFYIFKSIGKIPYDIEIDIDE